MLFNCAEKVGGVELYVVLNLQNLLVIMKIYFATNFNIFTKFLNHENLELYGRYMYINAPTLCIICISFSKGIML